MKKPPTIIFFLCLLTFSSFAQKTKKIEDKDSNTVYYVLKSNPTIKHGKYQKLDEAGRVVVEGYYKNGTKDSVWSAYKAGKLRSKGQYINEVQSGVWEFHDFKDNLKQKYDFTNKKLILDLSCSEKDKNCSDWFKKKFRLLNDNDSINVTPDQLPAYIGTDLAFAKRSFEMSDPEEAKQHKYDCYVYISFVINSNGKTSNHKIANSKRNHTDFGCGELALKFVKEIPDNWVPGVHNGKVVDVECTIKIVFSGH